MSNLKDQLIKMGSKNPDLRDHISVVLSRLEKRSGFSSQVDFTFPYLEEIVRDIEKEAEFELEDASFSFKPSSESHLRLIFDSTSRGDRALHAGEDPEKVMHRYIRHLSSADDFRIEQRSGSVTVDIYWR